MVKVGDRIKSNKGKGMVLDIQQRDDGRYIIVFKNKNKVSSLLEGDDNFKVQN